METTELFFVIRGGNPMYRRSWSVERVELLHVDQNGTEMVVHIHAGGSNRYATVSDAVDSLQVQLARHQCQRCYRSFAAAWRAVVAANEAEGLPIGQEIAWR